MHQMGTALRARDRKHAHSWQGVERRAAMTPYYEDDACTIYHGDAREFAGLIDADVVITDPPYGVGLTTKKNGYRRPGASGGYVEVPQASSVYPDDAEDVRSLIAAVFPPLLDRIGRALIYSGTTMLWAYPRASAVGCVFTPNGAGSSSWGFQTCHPILYYGKDPFLADGKGRRPNGFRTEQPNREDIDHPCPKPLKWMTWAVERASRPGETVLDPFMGSGTTLVAAKLCGRKAIGIERQEAYCEIAAKRLAQGVLAL